MKDEMTEIFDPEETGVSPTPSDPTLIKPCKGMVTQRFGENYDEHMALYGAAGHDGLDIANSEGTLIVSIAVGVVEWVDEDVNYGQYIRVWHPQLNLHSFYAHLLGIDVVKGQRVDLGEPIGRMGKTGNATGSHLHFELRLGQEFAYAKGTYGHGKGRVDPETVFYALVGLVF